MDRIGEITSRIKEWQRKNYAHPYKLDIFLTNRCNLKCRFCQFPLLDKKSYKNELSKQKLMEIIKQAARLDVKIVGLLGGEPFIRNDAILDLMGLIKEKGMDGSLVTNGTLLTRKQIEKIIHMQWNLIRFSIDGSTEKIHDSLRRAKSFKKIISTLGNFKELKQKDKNPAIEINSVLCRKNMKDLSGIIGLAHRYDIKNIYFLPMIGFTENIEDLKIREMDIPILTEKINLAKKLSQKYDVRTNLEQIQCDSLYTKSDRIDTVILEEKDQKSFIPCYLPWYGLNINPDGMVTPCSAASGNRELLCGEVNRYSLEEIWNSSGFKSLRKKMSRKELPNICSKCCVPLLDENNHIRALLQG